MRAQRRPLHSGSDTILALAAAEVMQISTDFFTASICKTLNDYLIQRTYDAQEKKSVSMFTYVLDRAVRLHGLRFQPESHLPKCDEARFALASLVRAGEGSQLAAKRIRMLRGDVYPPASPALNDEPPGR